MYVRGRITSEVALSTGLFYVNTNTLIDKNDLSMSVFASTVVARFPDNRISKHQKLCFVYLDASITGDSISGLFSPDFKAWSSNDSISGLLRYLDIFMSQAGIKKSGHSSITGQSISGPQKVVM